MYEMIFFETINLPAVLIFLYFVFYSCRLIFERSALPYRNQYVSYSGLIKNKSKGYKNALVTRTPR